MAEVTDDRLRLLIERIERLERLEEEKKGIGEDIRDVYAEAKAVGYDAKIMRRIVALRKMKPDDRAEMEAVMDTYLCALGMGFESTPLGAAIAKFEEATKDTAVSFIGSDGEEIPANRKAREAAAKAETAH